MDKILSKGNLDRAHVQVVSYKGVPDVDEMKVDDLQEYIRSHLGEIYEALSRGVYTPQPVLGVESPKTTGVADNLGYRR